MIGIVYKATNSLNGMVYIGQTIGTLEARKMSHIGKARSKSKEMTKFQKAISEVGEQNFIWEVIEEPNSVEEMLEKEAYWIAHYDATNDGGYNHTYGGKNVAPGRKDVLQYNTDGELLKQYDSAKNMAIETGFSVSEIRESCNGKRLSASGSICLYKDDWTSETLANEVNRRISLMSYSDKQIKALESIVCFDDKLQMKQYKSIYSASETLNIPVLKIKRNCKSMHFTLDNYVFLQKKDVPPIDSAGYEVLLQSIRGRFDIAKAQQKEGEYNKKVSREENEKIREKVKREELFKGSSLLTDAQMIDVMSKPIVAFNNQLQFYKYKSIHSANQSMGYPVLDIKNNCDGDSSNVKGWCFHYEDNIPEGTLEFIRSVHLYSRHSI